MDLEVWSTIIVKAESSCGRVAKATLDQVLGRPAKEPLADWRSVDPSAMHSYYYYLGPTDHWRTASLA